MTVLFAKSPYPDLNLIRRLSPTLYLGFGRQRTVPVSYKL